MAVEQRHHREVVPEAMAGERIDRLVSLVADVSRREANDLLEAGAVLINGQRPTKPSERVEADDTVEITVEARDDALRAEPDVEVDVVYHDDEVIVVNKPAHLIVHPGSGVRSGTLVNGLLARFPEIADVGEPDRPGIVHRLDKGTSGLLMVARTPQALQSLSAQLKQRTVTRRYLTMVDGLVAADSGVVDAPIGRSNRQPTLRAVTVDGRPARTRYQVLERFPQPDRRGLTLARCRLETGRTHQIRVHMAAIGHPVIGDHRYGAPTDDNLGLDRPFLHAAQLGFDQPRTGQPLSFTAEPPSDLETALTLVRSAS